MNERLKGLRSSWDVMSRAIREGRAHHIGQMEYWRLVTSLLDAYFDELDQVIERGEA